MAMQLAPLSLLLRGEANGANRANGGLAGEEFAAGQPGPLPRVSD
jgi:hypothetical protein